MTRPLRCSISLRTSCSARLRVALDHGYIRKRLIYPAMEAGGIPVIKQESGQHKFPTYRSQRGRKTAGVKLAQDQAGHSDISGTLCFGTSQLTN